MHHESLHTLHKLDTSYSFNYISIHKDMQVLCFHWQYNKLVYVTA